MTVGLLERCVAVVMAPALQESCNPAPRRDHTLRRGRLPGALDLGRDPGVHAAPANISAAAVFMADRLFSFPATTHALVPEYIWRRADCHSDLSTVLGKRSSSVTSIIRALRQGDGL